MQFVDPLVVPCIPCLRKNIFWVLSFHIFCVFGWIIDLYGVHIRPVAPFGSASSKPFIDSALLHRCLPDELLFEVRPFESLLLKSFVSIKKTLGEMEFLCHYSSILFLHCIFWILSQEMYLLEKQAQSILKYCFGLLSHIFFWWLVLVIYLCFMTAHYGCTIYIRYGKLYCPVNCNVTSICLQIFARMTPYNLGRAACVCRKWRYTVRNPVFWRNACLKAWQVTSLLLMKPFSLYMHAKC